MDTIQVKGIQIYAHHGLFDAERLTGQPFIIDCEMNLDVSTCNDKIEKTVHYGEVSMDIVKFATENRYDLLEMLANELSKHLLKKYVLIRTLTLTIHKPQAPIPTLFDDVALTVTRTRANVYLAIGSNMGQREDYLDMVTSEIISDDNLKLVRKSNYIETAPYGVTDQANFMNGALQVETIYTPQELLDFCHRVEEKTGRVRERVWGERTLDVDILMYDDRVIYTEHLKVPHPEMHIRGFVLQPMVEIAPYLMHPVYKKNMVELIRELNQF